MGYQATGRLHKIFETEQKSASFSAREFVIEIEDGRFPQMVKFQLVQDKCGLIDDHSEGDEISVEFDLRGREWNDKYFTNLNAWRIESATSKGGNAEPESEPAGTTTIPPDDDFDDEIPF